MSTNIGRIHPQGAQGGVMSDSRKIARGPVMSDGYTHCACRDCFELAIGKPGKAVCHECEEAGCDLQGECQAPHAYSAHCGDIDCCGPEDEC